MIQLIFDADPDLDPHWKKMDPDPNPGYFFKINWIFLTKQKKNFAYFQAKTWWTCGSGSGSKKPKSCGSNGSGF